MKYEGERKMGWSEWKSLKDHPFQRNTKDQAKRASKNHLHPDRWNPEIGQRVRAVWYGRTLYKLNGHTRTYLVSEGKLPSLPAVQVEIWRVETLKELRDLYECQDMSTQGKTAKQIMQSCLNGVGLMGVIRSAWLQRGELKTALAIATGNKSLHRYEQADFHLKEWETEIMRMDALRLPVRQKGWNQEAIAACLLSLRHWGMTPNAKTDRTILEFWGRLVENKGFKMDGKMDAVEAAYEAMQREMRSGVKAFKHQIDLCGVLLSCCRAWMEDRMYQTTPRPSEKAVFRKRRKDWT